MVLQLCCSQNLLGGGMGEVMKTVYWASSPEHPIYQVWSGMEVCISNKFPGDDAAAGLGTTV